MPNAHLNPNPLLWVGEHWVNYLRTPAPGAPPGFGLPHDPAPPGDPRDHGLVSLYHTRFSPAGEGTVALVIVRGPDHTPWDAVCFDNPALAEFIVERFVRG